MTEHVIKGRDKKTYISIDEAMARFGIVRSTVYKLAHGLVRYRFPAVAGNRVYLRLDELEARRLTPQPTKFH